MDDGLQRWFNTHARPLPWRQQPRRDPYLALVVECMAQQTRMDTVVARLPAFLERFPNVHALARASEGDVLAQWAGLGYYRRARLLHAAAREVVTQGGAFPTTSAGWRTLPGVGAYAAAALAAQVNGVAAPAIDGNVRRVLARLLGDPNPSLRSLHAALADRFGLDGAHAPERARNVEALIELGATVCTPRHPQCAACPLATECQAHRQGSAHSIPAVRRRPPQQRLVLHAWFARDHHNRVAIERRPDKGLWAATWGLPWREREPQQGSLVGRFDHTLTHRRIDAHVWLTPTPPNDADIVWQTREQLTQLPRIDTHALQLLDATPPSHAIEGSAEATPPSRAPGKRKPR